MNSAGQPIEKIRCLERSPGRRGGLLNVASGGDVMPSTQSLADLVGAIATERDRQAFALLFKYFAPRLKTFLMRAGLPANGAEDLVQETMLTVWRKAASFDALRGGASTWIFTIARNLYIDRKRRKRRDEFKDTDPADQFDAPPAADAAMMSAEREARLRAALKTLSEEQSTVLRLAFFSDKPHSEIARELGIPLGTVKSRARLAMSRLRMLLDDIS